VTNYVSEITFHGLQGHALAWDHAALDAWRDAGNIVRRQRGETLWETGCVFAAVHRM